MNALKLWASASATCGFGISLLAKGTTKLTGFDDIIMPMIVGKPFYSRLLVGTALSMAIFIAPVVCSAANIYAYMRLLNGTAVRTPDGTQFDCIGHTITISPLYYDILKNERKDD